MMKDSVLCVDIGTTSLKAGLISADGEVVFVCTKNFADCYSHFISHEWKTCLKSAVKDLKNSGVCTEFSIKSISISGNGPTLLFRRKVLLFCGMRKLIFHFSVIFAKRRKMN